MAATPATMPDLVCGAEVHPSTSAVTWDDADERYYFCSQDCREMFLNSLSDGVLQSYTA